MTATDDYDSPLRQLVNGDAGDVRFCITPRSFDSDLPDVGGLLAGASEVDITPPPGMPKAGFSKNAQDGNGFRNRLRARVLHLRAGRTSLAIVQLDLLSGSALLQHLVARAVAEATDVRLPGLFIGATHTHAGPGQFDASQFYNRFASNRPGFDPAWTQFLAGSIAGAVIEAVNARVPARVGVGRTEVWGLTRNRSLDPYSRNRTVPDKRLDPQRKFAAVNPWLHLVRVDAQAHDGGFRPLAAMTVFSVHGTGISHHCHEYHADLWAYLNDELARRVERSTGSRPVIGAIEGTHADCAPAIRFGRAGFIEAERVGRGIGVEAAELYDRMEGTLSGHVRLAAGIRELDLDNGGDVIGDHRLAPPLLGASQVAGAKENTTPALHLIPPFRAGYPKPFSKRLPHGAKWVLGSGRLQPLILPTRDFPRVLTIQVLRIGDTTVVGAPFEITVEAGRRIAEAVDRTGGGARAVPDGHRGGGTIVSSVANGYCGYCTTPEEYSRQYYEGGHNLHGPATQGWLAAQAARLADEVASVGVGYVSHLLPERRFSLSMRHYLPVPGAGALTSRQILAPAQFHDGAREDPGRWEFCFLDAPPGDLRWHDPLVRVEREDAHFGWTVVEDDQGVNLGLVHQGGSKTNRGHTYAARWYNPWLGAGRRHRFVVLANGGRPELSSDPFD
ncbi:MAG TPA: neutral/alkaline non-lysosomal ceramidase N-terminal domain-containing protein [Acidimicrobiales bacterium]|nr:neutral/alkaline non-lysosomal ceramidase N-terminal domain-containing protein [Acidimicrobiales bacterium]